MILVNLLPPELRRKEAPKIMLPEIPVKKTLLVLAAAILALQMLLSIVAVFYSTRYNLVRYEMGRLSPKLEGVRRDKKRTSVVAKKMQDIRTITEKKFNWALILNEISMTATRGIWLRTLSVEVTTVQKPVKEAPAPADKKSKKQVPDKKSKPEKKDDKKSAKKKAAEEKEGAGKKAAVEIEKNTVMKLEGSCMGGSGQETALIGKYLKSLRDDAYFKELFGTDIDLSGMNQRKMGEADVFDFTIHCRFKKDKQ